MNSNFSPKDLKEILKFSEEIAIKASKKLISYQKKINKLNVSSKAAQGVASDADLASEEIIINAIHKTFAKASILAEEDAFKKFGGKAEAYQHFKKDDFCFVIDPLDGTHNYLASMDYYAICISVVSRGQVVSGLVYRPPTGESYFAIEGGGAHKKNLLQNKRAVNLFQDKASKKLKDSMLVTGFATEKGIVFDNEFQVFKNLMGQSRGIRRLGSAALDLCLVADGVFDGFWERGLAPWDVAASGLICQEAGVKVSDYQNGKFQPFSETILAARTPLHGKLQKMMNFS